jgi:hypothetical protein
MKRVIWKFNLRAYGHHLSVPRGAKILSVQVQRGAICIWALVDADAPSVAVPYAIIATGALIPDPWKPTDYRGTVQLDGKEWGELVFHVFIGDLD